MKDSKKENLFAKLAAQQVKAEPETAVAVATPTETSPVQADQVKPRPVAPKKKPEPAKGKRDNPNYCQANAYVPKTLRRDVDRQLLDMDGMDYSSLVEDLLRKWLKSRGVSA